MSKEMSLKEKRDFLSFAINQYEEWTKDEKSKDYVSWRTICVMFMLYVQGRKMSDIVHLRVVDVSEYSKFTRVRFPELQREIDTVMKRTESSAYIIWERMHRFTGRINLLKRVMNQI